MRKTLIMKRHQALVNGGDGGYIGLYNITRNATREKYKDVEIEKQGVFYYVYGLK